MDLRDAALTLALVEAADRLKGVARHDVSDMLEELGGPGAVTAADLSGIEDLDRPMLERLRRELDASAIDRLEGELDRLRETAPGAWLTTVCDSTYPSNLRLIYNRPPFLFGLGELVDADARSMAVVGTRKASPRGLKMAGDLAHELARQGVTIVSGLARGIDAAAHQGALDAGGRTIAVLGHGIASPIYPPENDRLAKRIIKESRGALISQFWPTQHQTQRTFPQRNVVTSGLAMGTVVVEASATSGAKMQARLCLEHGKRLFLVQDLVMHEDWAKDYARRPGVVVVRDIGDIVETLDSARPHSVQLSFG